MITRTVDDKYWLIHTIFASVLDGYSTLARGEPVALRYVRGIACLESWDTNTYTLLSDYFGAMNGQWWHMHDGVADISNTSQVRPLNDQETLVAYLIRTAGVFGYQSHTLVCEKRNKPITQSHVPNQLIPDERGAHIISTQSGPATIYGRHCTM